MKEAINDRWAFENIDSAVLMIARRFRQKISCIIDPLGEYSRTPEQAQEAFQNYINTVKKLADSNLQVAMAVKPSAIGLNFDQKAASELMFKIFETAASLKIDVELDIEGTPTVEAICKLATECAKRGYKTTLALQAYLKRTEDDIKIALDSGVKVRLVKGAYKGDVDDFAQIQQMFFERFTELKESGARFDLGTHDPELLKHINSSLSADQRQRICFGFLKGLADQTKSEMAENGLIVYEYVPFGQNRKAYETRREAYLKRLAELNRKPAP